jgi:hypothetical protein
MACDPVACRSTQQPTAVTVNIVATPASTLYSCGTLRSRFVASR